MNEEFSFELSETLKKIAPSFTNEVYKAKIIPEIEGVYAVSGGTVVDVEYYEILDVVDKVANGHWVIVE